MTTVSCVTQIIPQSSFERQRAMFRVEIILLLFIMMLLNGYSNAIYLPGILNYVSFQCPMNMEYDTRDKNAIVLLNVDYNVG